MAEAIGQSPELQNFLGGKNADAALPCKFNCRVGGALDSGNQVKHYRGKPGQEKRLNSSFCIDAPEVKAEVDEALDDERRLERAY
ncbi:hypothetical protein QTH91_19215 [Variovorax dokdonensis]|uniref:Uncharacterized protein n=1 Tax=Variovorax dokdonensis TaxID=344883 RepID=A0ABT7NFC9_9BURK|nr:hypothetical protein [Variovorax dokdonensis]MDM0046628.1 hypothetical protein [Variovorax dokdonensis]